MKKNSFISLLLLPLLFACQKSNCSKFDFSDAVLKSLPRADTIYEVNNDQQIEVTEIIIDSTKYAITTPFKHQICESVILVYYKLNDYSITARLSKKEGKSNLFCSIAGIDLSRYIIFENEHDFLKSNYQVYKIDETNDTILIIQMNRLNIKKINK